MNETFRLAEAIINEEKVECVCSLLIDKVLCEVETSHLSCVELFMCIYVFLETSLLLITIFFIFLFLWLQYCCSSSWFSCKEICNVKLESSAAKSQRQ